MFCIKEYLNHQMTNAIKEIKTIIEKTEWDKFDSKSKEIIGNPEKFYDAINKEDEAAFLAYLSVASFPLCSICPKVNTPNTINKSDDLRMYSILLQMSPDFSSEEASAYREFIRVSYFNIYGTEIQHDKMDKELRNYLHNKQLDEAIQKMSMEMLTYYYLVISMGDIQHAIDIVVSHYLRKCNFKRLSFARSEHFIDEKCVLNIGYSLDEGNADYYALEGTKEIMKSMQSLSDEAYEEFVHMASTTQYYFEKKMVGWLIGRFGIENYEKTWYSSINVLSSQFIEDPCLIYKLLRWSDLGKWRDVHKIINTIKVDKNGNN